MLLCNSERSDKMETLIFGHRNPDADSVCSAIALSYLYNKCGYTTVPRVLGHLNKESEFILDYFKVKAPLYLNDTKVQIEDIDYNKKAYKLESDSILNAFNYMQQEGLTAIPLVDDKKKLKGFVSLKEIAKFLISGEKEKFDTNYQNILNAVNGKELLKFDDEIVGKVILASYKSETFQEENNITSENIVIVGDRYKVLEYVIDKKVKLIVLTGNHTLPSDLLEKARANKINVIISAFNSFYTTDRVILSNRIGSININEKPVTVNLRDYRTDFVALANKLGHTNYPVINNKNECMGLLKVTSADSYEKQKVILVDHTDFNQTAIGIEEAEITEIIDHHNLSAIGTKVPIDVRTKPVGSTCTIIYKMFRERNIDIPRDIAGVMLSAILSDTMIFKSPTATPEDIEVANNLALIAGVDVNDYGYKMFKAASSIKGMSVADLINIDFKGYNVGNSQIAISQVFTMDYEEIEKNLDEYLDKLDEISKNYICVVSFITDVYKNGSYILYNRAASEIVKDALNLDEVYPGVYIPDLVSRKKQMLPALLEVIEKRV